MKVEILRSTTASGERVEAGKSYDLSDSDANYLIALKKAIKAKTVTKKKVTKK